MNDNIICNMKTLKNMAVILFALVLMVGCKEDLPYGWQNSFHDIEFDKSEMNVPVNSQTKDIVVDFHRNGKQAPEGYLWRADFTLTIDNKSTAELNKHFKIADIFSLIDNDQSFAVKYNKTSSTGDFVVTVIPSAITAPVDIVIRNLYFNEDGSQAQMVIHLIPQAQ